MALCSGCAAGGLRVTLAPVDKTESSAQFGYRKVSAGEKTRLIGDVFESVAHRYDLMNDLMSLGSHRALKRMLVEMAGLHKGRWALDLAGGTGDLARLMAPRVGSEGRVVLADPNPAMLALGRDRLLNGGIAEVQFCRAAAEALPFPADRFDCATVGFGLRNFTDKQAALSELKRVLKPGGALLVLEFSKPKNPWLAAAGATAQSLWPTLGRLVTGDGDSYRYLVESIRLHPSQEALKLMLEDARFAAVEFHNLLGGMIAIHRGVA